MSMKRKRKIYLDTSVVSHLDAPDVPDKMADTWRLWYLLEQGEIFDVKVSIVTEFEIKRCSEPKGSQMACWLENVDYEMLYETSEVLELTEELLKYGVLARKHMEDVLHIAYAVTSGCEYIVSWNFKHIVNTKTMDRVDAVNILNGYPAIKIVSPTILIEGISDE